MSIIADHFGAAPRRRIRWRLRKGKHWFDLVEEEGGRDAPIFIGQIDGHEVFRSADRVIASLGLIRESVGVCRGV